MPLPQPTEGGEAKLYKACFRPVMTRIFLASPTNKVVEQYARGWHGKQSIEIKPEWPLGPREYVGSS